MLPVTGRICIDPGHPSEVGRGTRGRHLTEIQAAWRVARRLKALLEADGATVRLTKQREGEFVANRQRAHIANEFAADLFVRLHCDASSGTGFAVYYPNRVGHDRDGRRGPSKDVLRRCRDVAPRFHAALARGLRGHLRDNGLLPDTRTAVGARQGALTGSIWSEVPVVLVEMCVLTNRRDEAFLSSPSGQERTARALADAVAAAIEER